MGQVRLRFHRSSQFPPQPRQAVGRLSSSTLSIASRISLAGFRPSAGRRQVQRRGQHPIDNFAASRRQHGPPFPSPRSRSHPGFSARFIGCGLAPSMPAAVSRRSGPCPGRRRILRRDAVRYGLGAMAPNRPSCSPFGPAVKYTVSVLPPLPPLPTRRLHKPSMTIACPRGSRILSINSPVVGS